MLPQSALTGTSARLPIDIRRFPWIRRLAADYAWSYDNLSDFFAGNPADPDACRAAILRAQRHQRERLAVADVVRAQQTRRGAPPRAMAAAAELRDEGTVAILTGQQAGLFGGPLFTLLKAVTALQLAAQIRAVHHVPTVAIFWIDSEDHDWDEIKSCGTFDAELAARTLTVGDPPGARQGPVGRLAFDESVTVAVAELESCLPLTEHTQELLSGLRAAYRPGEGVSEAFGRWLETVLGPHGLIVYDAADPAGKPLVVDLFTQEIEHPGRTSRLAAEAGAALEARGYHAQVAPHEGNLAIFHLDGGREPIQHDRGKFHVGDRTLTRAELLQTIRTRPADFSPNVLLRPLVQDTLFPTICYVAGPNELAYLAQLRGVYTAFNIPMPLMHQRASATLLDSNAMRFVTRHSIPLESLQPRDEALLNALLESQLPPGVEEAFQDAEHGIRQRMETLATSAAAIDATLEGAARSTLGRMQDDLKKFHAKIIQAAKRKDETLRRQFKHAQEQAFPAGQPQEREIGFVYFLDKHGPGLVDRLIDELPLNQGTHWVLTI